MACLNLIRMRLLAAMGCPYSVMMIELAIASFMEDREIESVRLGLELLAELLGHTGSPEAGRKFAYRLLNASALWQTRANVRTYDCERGERNVRRVTSFRNNRLNAAALAIAPKLKTNGEATVAQIDQLAEAAIIQHLRRPLTAIKRDQKSKRADGVVLRTSQPFTLPETMPEKLANALALARQGFRIFPREEKRPRITRWQQLATTCESTILKWEGRWPGTDWAILCGTQLPGGGFLTAFDLDLHKGKFGNGFITTSLREEDLGELPETFTSPTPSGGEHRLFRSTEPLPNSSGLLGPGLDCKSKVGLVAVYEDCQKLSVAQIAQLPEAWEYALSVNRTLKKRYGEGERHSFLCRVAYAMACQGKSVSEILNTLRYDLEFNCVRGGRTIEERELEALARSAVKRIAEADSMLRRIVA